MPDPLKLTPVYLGKATVTNEGNFSFDSAVLTTTQFPAAPDQLVPKAYVDKYMADTLAYMNKVFDGNDLNDLFTRLSRTEEELNRLYLALYNVHRNTLVISTVQNPELTISLVSREVDNAAVLAEPPVAPITLDGFN